MGIKKLAFSVWPVDGFNRPKEELTIIRNNSVAILEAAGFETDLVTDFNPFDECSALLFHGMHTPLTVKDYTNYSDYIRLTHLRKMLYEYDEVMYFDYDLLIFNAPSAYGCFLQSHFSTDENTGDIEKTEKFWFRGTNGAIYLNRTHLPHMEAHLKDVQKYITSCSGKVGYCYPMDHMHHFEENIGYIPGYYLFGSLETPNFCTKEKSLNIIKLTEDIYGEEFGRINAVNLMGSRNNENYKKAVEHYEGINVEIGEFEYNKTRIKGIIRNCIKPLRVNYNSKKMRNLIKHYIQEDSLFE